MTSFLSFSVFYVFTCFIFIGVWVQTNVEYENRGDVVIFRSNGKYFHGMSQVLKGDNEHCHRVAVGLLHRQKV